MIGIHMARYDIWTELGRRWLVEHRRFVMQGFACVLILAIACWCYKPASDTVVQGQSADLEKLASHIDGDDRKEKGDLVYDAGKNRRAISLGDPFASTVPVWTETSAPSRSIENLAPVAVMSGNHRGVAELASQLPRVMGVLGSEGQWVVLLSLGGSSRAYRTGERIEAYTVGPITDRIVELRKDGQTVTLNIGGGTEQ